MELQWSLIIFTFFMCAAAGTFALQGLLTFQGRGVRMQNLSIVVTLILLIIGGIGVFTHLQHWERMFNGFGHITSGITWELIFVILFGISIVLFFLFKQRSEDLRAPKWCGALGLVMGLALVVVMSISYLMAARPAWNTFLLILYYLANAFFMGGLVALFIASATGERACVKTCAKTSLFGGIAQVVILLAYTIYLQASSGSFSDVGYYFDPTLPDVAVTEASNVMLSMISGSAAPLFWVGVVVVGLVVPIAILIRERKCEEPAPASGIPGKAKDAEQNKVSAEDASEGEGKKKGFFMFSGPVLSGKQKACYAVALIACAAGGVCWRMVLYMLAISAFPIY